MPIAALALEIRVSRQTAHDPLPYGLWEPQMISRFAIFATEFTFQKAARKLNMSNAFNDMSALGMA